MTDIKTMAEADLIALSQELGRQVDELREQRAAIAGELRSRASKVADKRAKLQAQLAALDGEVVESVDAVAEGASLTVARGEIDTGAAN